MKNLIFLTPIYNEELSIEQFLSTINKNLKSIKNFNIEYLFINDGSTDRSEIKLNKILKFSDNIDLISLKKNYGKEIAMQIGLIYVYLNKKKIDYVCIIDADLQHPIKSIISLINNKRINKRVYQGIRIGNHKGAIYNVFLKIFYFLFNILTLSNIKNNITDFSFFSRSFLRQIILLNQKIPILKLSLANMNKNTENFYFKVNKRVTGKSNFGFPALLHLSLKLYAKSSIKSIFVIGSLLIFSQILNYFYNYNFKYVSITLLGFIIISLVFFLYYYFSTNIDERNYRNFIKK